MSQPPGNEGTGTPTATAMETEATAEELLDLLQRERADFRNYRRRVEAERAGDRERSRGELLLRILPLLDELDRALAQVPDDLAAHPWAQGVGLSRHGLSEALAKLGLVRFGAPGDAFDPARHEALFYEPRPDLEDAVVSHVMRPGYLLGNRLLRPAQVSVIGPPTAPESAAAEPPAAETESTSSTDDTPAPERETGG